MRGHYGQIPSHDPRVEGILDDIGGALKSAANAVVNTAKGAGRGIYNAAKGAGKAAITFVHKPPAWFSVAFPLMTIENQRYWAGKVGGASGEQLYDAGLKSVMQKTLGPAGPALVDTYNQVTADAVNGNLNALQIIAKAPQIVTLAIASKKGPVAFQEAVARINASTAKAPATAASAAAPAATTTAGDTMNPYADFSDEEALAVMIGCGCTPTNVGSWLPFLLGIPVGAVAAPLAAYAYMRHQWNKLNPNVPFDLGAMMSVRQQQAQLPATTAGQESGYSDGYGDDSYNIDDTYAYDGAPSGEQGPAADECWLAMVGADASPWGQSQTKALIDSAIAEVTSYASSFPPAAAYVWSLEAPTGDPYAGNTAGSTVVLEGTTSVVPFSSQRAALDYLRQVAQTRPLALAMFDRSSSHWPNPTAWRKSDDPAAAQLIAQHVANKVPTQMGAWGSTSIGNVVDDVRRRAQLLADQRVGDVIGVIHTSNDGLWHTLAFRAADDADEWFGAATLDPAMFTYAAYFDKSDVQWPYPVNEKIGGARDASRPSDPILRDPATVSGTLAYRAQPLRPQYLNRAQLRQAALPRGTWAGSRWQPDKGGFR